MPYLSWWAREMEAHLKEFRPKMHRDLLQAGTLGETCQAAADQAVEEYGNLIDRGVEPNEARRMARVQYLLLPSEKDVPDTSLFTNPGAPENV
jgi:hypothetical protein